MGLIDGPSKLDDPSPVAVVDASLLEREPGVAISIMAVGLRPGTDLNDLRAQLDWLPDGQSFGLEPAQLVSPETRTAVEGQARGFWLLAAIATLAATVVLGQLITRTVRLSADDGPRLWRRNPSGPESAVT